MVETGKRAHLGRLALVMMLITLWTLLILLRLGQLQILRHQDFALLALQRQQVTRSILAPRGIIYDAHMDELATSVTVRTVAAEPKRIRDVVTASRNLASILGLNPSELLARMTDPAKQVFQIIKRRIDPEMEPRIEALAVEGVYLVEESTRVYPNRAIASHVLGFVNMNGDGGAGIELQYDKELKGTQGQISFDIDARRQSFRGKVEKPPVQGRSLILSIDRSIQYIAERELASGIERAHALRGTAIVMESDTGRILALAVNPDFNCNAYNEYPAEAWRNRAISDLFEPGSTFKVVVATAALEAGLTQPQEIIDCQMGSITIGKHVFHDHKPYGLLTFNQILEFSSNVGAAKLGLRLGEQRLHDALCSFGFGSKTNVDLPGEIAGLVRDWRQWSGLSVGAISFGQEIGVTSLQILRAVNAIANGGYRTRPSVVDRVIDQRGDLVRVRTQERTRIMSPETARAVREAFEGVILRGTGHRAALEGYRAAGKTGTAQKTIDGRYSNTKYLASFIGFAPLPAPRISVLVQIDEPQGMIYGGDVAAPVFQRIAQETLLQLRVPPDKTLPLPKFNATVADAGTEDFLPNASPVAPLVASGGDTPAGETAIKMRVGTETAVMPDFRGLAKRKVVDRCLELGIQMQASGSGIAVFQAPPPGTTITVGDTCSVTFARNNTAAFLKVPGVDPRPRLQQAISTPQSAAVKQ